jgi:type IV secretory pathway VirB4 component
MADDPAKNQIKEENKTEREEDAQVPAWLKKADETSVGDSDVKTEDVSAEPAAPAGGEEKVVAAAPVSEEKPVGEKKEGLPAWLKMAKGEPEGAKPVEEVKDKESREAKPPKGMLETSKEEKPEKKEEATAAPAAEVNKDEKAVIKEEPKPEETAVSMEAEEKKKEAKAKAKKKKDVFNSARDLFVKSVDKVGSAMDKGKTAGVPEAKPKAKPEDAKVEGAEKSVAEKADEKTTKKEEKKPSAKETMEERKKLVEAEKIYQQGLTTIRDLIAPSSMEIKYDSLRVEGMFSRSFYVYAYPRYLETNWLSPIVNFDVTMDISQFIYPIDSSSIMKVLKKKVTQMQSSVRMKQEKGMVSDPGLDTALQDAEELRVQIQRGQEKLFQFALYFTIYADDEKKIDKIAKHLESLLGGKLVLTKRADLQMEHAFNSTIPLCLDELEINTNMNTSPLSSTFPFSSSDLTSDEGILYGLNRHNDSLIIFDRFSLENANSVVFAKSGAGKSYGVKLEILRSMMTGTDVIVIDPENEYEALSQTVGGSYLRVSLTSDRRINPFDLPRPLKDEEPQPGDLLRTNIINLSGLLKIMLGGTSPEEEAILDKALIDVYALKGITMELIDPSEVPPPTMEDLYEILSTMEGASSIAQRLQKFTSGTYSGIFNKPTNIDLQSGLMVFSIRDLEDALRPIAMYIILNYIWSRVRSELKKRILVIDEAWTMMQYEDSAKFMFGLVKRARKYFLGITTITQDVEDFIKSPYGKPVVTNSSMQLLLKQAPASVDILGKVFNLTEGEKYMLLNSGVGQGLFFAGLKHVAIQIIASYTEDKIVTTNPEEILQTRADEASYETAEETLAAEETPAEEPPAEEPPAEEPAADTPSEEPPTEEPPAEEQTPVAGEVPPTEIPPA